jgi:hypothetical protein
MLFKLTRNSKISQKLVRVAGIQQVINDIERRILPPNHRGSLLEVELVKSTGGL